MLKPTVLKIVIAVLLGGGFYFVASNSHLDAFPCEVAHRDSRTDRLGAPAGEMCSLLTIKNKADWADRAELTGGGYAVMVLLFGVLPYLVGAAIGHAATKKKRAAA